MVTLLVAALLPLLLAAACVLPGALYNIKKLRKEGQLAQATLHTKTIVLSNAANDNNAYIQLEYEFTDSNGITISKKSKISAYPAFQALQPGDTFSVIYLPQKSRCCYPEIALPNADKELILSLRRLIKHRKTS